ncbi:MULTISPECIES: hypothetical protein [Bhargavaea]|uniref:Uncharacterized protein n=1 Tax=Bhargavaea changchunensis TaxID=2134037 RepID=A0ABW2NER1_9BACL|nr:hypothetical protein [Bhargavaea sp. CC-171006]
MYDLISIMRELSSEWIGNDETKVASFLSRFKDFYNFNERHQYSQITAFIYTGISDPERDLLGENLQLVLEEAILEEALGEISVAKQIGKIIDHINLAASQKTLIENLSYNALELVERRAESLKTQEKKIQEQAKILDDEIKDLKEKERSLVTQFVTILGIFASIIFAAFGGFQIISNTINHLSSDLRIGMLMIFSSMVMIGVVVLLYVLLNGIAKITGQNFRSCGCDGNNNVDCDHSMLEKYPVFCVVLVILFYFFFLGLSAFVFDYGLIFNRIFEINFISSLLKVIAIGILMLWPAPLLWKHFFPRNKLKKERSRVKFIYQLLLQALLKFRNIFGSNEPEDKINKDNTKTSQNSLGATSEQSATNEDSNSREQQ